MGGREPRDSRNERGVLREGLCEDRGNDMMLISIHTELVLSVASCHSITKLPPLEVCDSRNAWSLGR